MQEHKASDYGWNSVCRLKRIIIYDNLYNTMNQYKNKRYIYFKRFNEEP